MHTVNSPSTISSAVIVFSLAIPMEMFAGLSSWIPSVALPNPKDIFSFRGARIPLGSSSPGRLGAAFTAATSSSPALREVEICISKIASSQKSTNCSIRSPSPSLMQVWKKAFLDSRICGFSHSSMLASSISK